jgi:hypothetical protein
MENKMTTKLEKEMYRHRLEYLESRIGSMTDHEQWEAVAEIKRLSSTPVASDKAVCPKCGHREMFTPETKSVCCFQCGEIYDVEIMVISKPRTEKGGDRK